MSQSRIAETTYYEGVIDELFTKWDKLSGSHAVAITADPISARVALLRRLTKALLKYESEIPFHRGQSYVDQQYRCYMRLFDYEAKLKHAIATASSLRIPLNVEELASSVEASLFFDAFNTAVMEWIQMNGVIRQSGVDNEETVRLTVMSNPSLKATLKVKMDLALTAADGNFVSETQLEDETKLLLGFYAQKLRQIASIYGIELSSTPSENAVAEVVAENLLPELPEVDTTPVGEYYVDEQERKNVEKIAMTLMQRAREKELSDSGAVTQEAAGVSGPKQPAVVHWVKFDPTGQPADTIRTKLVQFYTIFNAEKVDDVDDILDHYAGREGELFAALEAKYCGISNPQGTGEAASSSSATTTTVAVAGHSQQNGHQLQFSEQPLAPPAHAVGSSGEVEPAPATAIPMETTPPATRTSDTSKPAGQHVQQEQQQQQPQQPSDQQQDETTKGGYCIIS